MRIRDEQKEALVKEKAIELLVEYGFEGFSMQKLAREVGISPATLYIYYSDKEDLIKKLGLELDVVARGFEKAVGEPVEVHAGKSDGGQRI